MKIFKVLLSALAIGVLFTGCGATMKALFNAKVNVPVVEVGKINEKYACNLSVVSNNEQFRQNLLSELNDKILHPNLAMKNLNDEATIINIVTKQKEEVVHKKGRKISSSQHQHIEYRDDEHKIKELKVLKGSGSSLRCKDVHFNLDVDIDVKDKDKKLLFSKRYHMDESYTRCEHNYARIPYYQDIYNKFTRIISRQIAAELMTKFKVEFVFLEDDLDIKLTSKQNELYDISFKLINKMDYITALTVLTKLDDEVSHKSYILEFNMGLLYEGLQDYKKAKKYFEKAKAIIPKTDTKISKQINEAHIRMEHNIKLINNTGGCIVARY